MDLGPEEEQYWGSEECIVGVPVELMSCSGVARRGETVANGCEWLFPHPKGKIAFERFSQVEASISVSDSAVLHRAEEAGYRVAGFGVPGSRV